MQMEEIMDLIDNDHFKKWNVEMTIITKKKKASCDFWILLK